MLTSSLPPPSTNQCLWQVAVSSPPCIVRLEQLRETSALEAMPGRWDTCLDRGRPSSGPAAGHQRKPQQNRKHTSHSEESTPGRGQQGPAILALLSLCQPDDLAPLLRSPCWGLGAERRRQLTPPEGCCAADPTSLKLGNAYLHPKSHHTRSPDHV